MMNWYYVKNGEQQGPVAEGDLKVLVETNAITRDGLVWREGMSDWVSYASLFPEAVNSAVATPPKLSLASQVVRCPSCDQSVAVDLLIPTGDTQVCPHCRDSYLQRIKEGVPLSQSSEWVAIREAHIQHEASVRSIGALYYLGGGLMCLGGLGMVMATFVTATSGSSAEVGVIAVIMVVYLVLGVISIVIGRGYRRLRSWVKIPGGIFAGLGLLAFPLGTLINGYVLYLLFSEKGRVVFSPEYQEIRDATPGVRPRTSAVAWCVLIFLVLGVLALIGLGVANSG